MPRNFAPGFAGVSHFASYGAALGFPNLSAVCSSHNLSTIFRWVALLSFSLQGFVPLAQPHWLVTGGMPSWCFSLELACSLLVRELSRAHATLPRIHACIPLVTFRAFVCTRIDLRFQATINVSKTGLPLLGVSPPHGLSPITAPGSRPGPRYASPVHDPEGQTHAALDGLPSMGVAPLSPGRPSISRFVAFDRLTCFEGRPVRAYSAEPIHLDEPYPSQGRAHLFAPLRLSCQGQESRSSRRTA